MIRGEPAFVVRGVSGRPLSVAWESGSRVECWALVPWIVPHILDHIGGYWLGDFGEHGQGSPASSVRFTFGLEE